MGPNPTDTLGFAEGIAMSSDQPRGVSTGTATRWLAARGLVVAENTVRLWCQKGRWCGVALRTAGGHYRIPVSALAELLSERVCEAAA